MLTERFDTALSFVSKLHRLQIRKGTEIPYLGHLLAVAALVIEDGGSEDEAIAALLHDAIEDQGQYYPRGRDALRLYIRDQFVTVCFICEHKQVWTDLQAKARLRELIG
jgi:predicted HD phosphohydrolase